EISTLGAVMAIAFKNPFVPICRSSTLSRWHEEGTALRQAQGEGEGARSGRQTGVGPVEPRAERIDIGGVDGCPAPDTQTRRGVAVASDVIGCTLGFEQARELLDKIRVGARNRKAHRGFRPARGIVGEVA